VHVREELGGGRGSSVGHGVPGFSLGMRDDKLTGFCAP
jgi:hypothetical protein